MKETKEYQEGLEACKYKRNLINTILKITSNYSQENEIRKPNPPLPPPPPPFNINTKEAVQGTSILILFVPFPLVLLPAYCGTWTRAQQEYWGQES